MRPEDYPGACVRAFRILRNYLYAMAALQGPFRCTGPNRPGPIPPVIGALLQKAAGASDKAAVEKPATRSDA